MMKEKDRDIIYRLKCLEREQQKRRGSDKLAAYNAGGVVHEKQLLFHKSQKRNRWIFGGNRTGKTECGAVETIWLARGIHPYRKNKPDVSGWVVSVSYEVQRDVAQAKLFVLFVARLDSRYRNAIGQKGQCCEWSNRHSDN
jgi:hypothetical protein